MQSYRAPPVVVVAVALAALAGAVVAPRVAPALAEAPRPVADPGPPTEPAGLPADRARLLVRVVQ